MRPLKFMWQFGVKYPAKATGALAYLLVQLELNGWLKEKYAARIKRQHEAAGEIVDVAPPAVDRNGLKAAVYGSNHTVRDISGIVLTVVNSEHRDFVDALRDMEPGLVLVTVRIERDTNGAKLIAAYAQGRHVGWIPPRSGGINDDWLWIRELNREGFFPRFKGKVFDLNDGSRFAALLIPKVNGDWTVALDHALYKQVSPFSPGPDTWVDPPRINYRQVRDRSE